MESAHLDGLSKRITDVDMLWDVEMEHVEQCWRTLEGGQQLCRRNRALLIRNMGVMCGYYHYYFMYTIDAMMYILHRSTRAT